MQEATRNTTDPLAESLVANARTRRARAPIGRERITAFAVATCFLAVAVPFAIIGSTSRSPSALSVLILVALYAVFSRIEFEVATVTVVPSELALVPMLAMLPAKAIPLYVAAGLIAAHAPDYLRGRHHRERVPQLIGNAWFSFGSVLVLLAAGEPGARLGALPIYVLALGAQFVADGSVTMVRERLAIGLSPRSLLRPLMWVFMIDSLLFPIGFLAAAVSMGHEFAPVLTAPLAVLMVIFSREHRANISSTLELSQAYRGTAFLLGDVIESDDAYTGSHSRDVVDLVLGVCDRLALDDRARRKAEFTALLHDVGKIRIPSEVINKPGPLSPEERLLMNNHTIVGQRLLERVGGLLGEIGTLVRSCHEHFDGNGYPDRLSGEEIPLISRVVCCCDAFNAMTTDRPYRRAAPLPDALAELERCSGSQFDPAVVHALVGVVTGRSDLRIPKATAASVVDPQPWLALQSLSPPASIKSPS